MKWLIAQRTGTVSVDTLDRDDVTVVDAPAECIGFITGFKGQTLREIEASSGTFIFTDAGSKDSETGQEKVLVFSHDKHNRKRAKSILEQRIDDKMNHGGRSSGGGRDGYDR